MVQLEQPRMLFFNIRDHNNTTNHDKINQVRKTKHPLPVNLTLDHHLCNYSKTQNRALKTYIIPTQQLSRKRPMKKKSGTYGNQKIKKLIKHDAEEKSSPCAYPSRERNPRPGLKPNLCETWVMEEL